MTSRSRRNLLKSTAAIAAAAALPEWYVQQLMAQPAPPVPKSPNEQINVGLVGCGGMGTGDGKNASNFGKIVAVCDVDKNHLEQASKKNFPGAEPFTDFRKMMERKDIDAVICGTVDHWHTLVGLAAMKSGKDVYIEKPLTLTIDEGKRLRDMQKATGRVLQTGTQQRSEVRFQLAANLIRNGRIGKVKHVDVWLPAGLRKGPFQESKPPEHFDYDFWLGQTPAVPYVKERTHFSFRYFWEYSGGTMTDWGAHHNDIALWVLGHERSGPVSAEGKQLVEMIPGGFTAASEYDVTYTYPDGVTHRSRSTTDSEWNGGTKQPKRDGAQLHGLRFEGTDGWLWVTRGEIKASDDRILKDKLPDTAPRVYESKNHMGNFFDCIRSRKETICPAEIGHRSATMCHLGVLSIRLGKKVNYDPVKEAFVNDPEAEKMAVRPMREGYDYKMIGL